MIHCESISHAFSGISIFNELDIIVRPGEHLCISGASGRGKTSLLKMLQGYIIPDKGRISINGQLLGTKTIRQIRESITWIPQNTNIPVRNGLELLSFLGAKLSLGSIAGYLDALGLHPKLIEKDFDKISGGEQQRIIISIGLSLNRDIIIMDEPSSSLDENSIQLLIDLVRSLGTKTIISASHNQKWLSSAERVVRL